MRNMWSFCSLAHLFASNVTLRLKALFNLFFSRPQVVARSHSSLSRLTMLTLLCRCLSVCQWRIEFLNVVEWELYNSFSYSCCEVQNWPLRGAWRWEMAKMSIRNCQNCKNGRVLSLHVLYQYLIIQFCNMYKSITLAIIFLKSANPMFLMSDFSLTTIFWRTLSRVSLIPQFHFS